MKKIGILGAGQLGKMLSAAASKSYVPVHFMDTSADMPASYAAASMTIGDIQSYEDVMRFGADKDVISIEIEAVSADALRTLADQGKRVLPSPGALQTIKDKGLQKQFYTAHDIPTAAYLMYGSKADVWRAILSGEVAYPFVQKARLGGYDGKGVAVIKTEDDLPELLDTPCLVEALVPIHKEVATIFARSGDQIIMMPPVEMVFDEKLNLLSHLLCPAHIGKEQQSAMEAMGRRILEGLDTEGLLAIEYFIDTEGQVLVNEVAPRPHNSGHHSIEGCSHSQYDLMLRCLLGQPLPAVELRCPAAMINLVGAEGHKGEPHIEGLDHLLSMTDAHLHWYGKKETRPGRKMGHVTLLHQDVSELERRVKLLQDHLQIISL